MRPWRDWFKSNYVVFLERQVEMLRTDHALEIPTGTRIEELVQ